MGEAARSSFLPRCEATAGGAERGTREAEGAFAAKRRALRAPPSPALCAGATSYRSLRSRAEEKGVAARAGRHVECVPANGFSDISLRLSMPAAKPDDGQTFCCEREEQLWQRVCGHPEPSQLPEPSNAAALDGAR